MFSMCTNTRTVIVSPTKRRGQLHSIQVNLTGVPAIVVGLIVGNINSTAGSK